MSIEDRPIALYFHCSRCVLENKKPKLAVGIVHGGEAIQAWCEVHDLPVGPPFELAERYPIENCKCALCKGSQDVSDLAN